ncbi:MAG: GIY-YIG nuclease family protein [Candidatus Levyibacteriota bacterium]
MTDTLVKRTYQHKNNLVDGFTKKYNVHRLVYFEQTNDVSVAILREKQMKKWNRSHFKTSLFCHPELATL